MSNFAEVTIYTDGSCLNNGAPDACGGWAAILTFGKHEKEITGSEVGTKNNRMELTAVLKGVEALKVPCNVKIVSDSQYVGRCFASASMWRAHGWRTENGNRVANIDLIKALEEAKTRGHHNLWFQYIPGHKGHKYNERCDKLARAEARKAQEETDKLMETDPKTFMEAVAALEGTDE